MQQTPLNQTHRQMGAKMVDFSGWDMPVHYGSQIEEHHSVRQNAGMFDVSHMTIVDIRGPQALDFLRRLLANDVARLTLPGKALYSCMLNEAGGVIDDLIVYFMANDEYRLIVNAATCDKDLAWIAQQSKPFDVSAQQQTGLAMIAVQGPNACALAQKVMPTTLLPEVGQLTRFAAIARDGWFVARTGYTGEDGYEWVMPASQVVAIWQQLATLGVAPIGLGARDTLRLEAGMALYGNELDEHTSPLESGLAWTVDMQAQDRHFTGKAALQAQLDRGVDKKLVGLILDGRGVLRRRQRVLLEGNPVGEVTSGTFSPTLAKTIALARVSRTLEHHCEVDIRGKSVAARVVNYPFVKQGQACV